ncbi:hypothetical protein C8T65DRAFT_590661 [Cerioporus squamosus]|nr:hypothetical protein C8T65DRAFT_590661 [Cerioporus squamosus]
MVIRDVPTRWNSTHAMMQRGLLLRKAIDLWVFQHPALRDLLLTDSEWKTISKLTEILEVS